MHVFTSITANYLPKARVLAATLKRFHPDAVFHLVLADCLPPAGSSQMDLFDSILTLEDLCIPNHRAWAFEHTVVELCTAIKGPAARLLLEEHGGDLFYFDPDIAILAPLDGLRAELDRTPILLTPHQTSPEKTSRAVVDNEICSLIHGVFNLGFLGLRASKPAFRFANWWNDRLLHHCFDDKANGLFTDQRWIDLAPCFFPELGILRDPQYNVATWNLTQRRITGQAPFGLAVDGKPLVFYHFSGLDSGGQEVMLQVYGKDSPVLWELREWYLQRCNEFGQEQFGKDPGIYGLFDNGTPVTKAMRHFYRHRKDIRDRYSDPYSTADSASSFLHWWQWNAAAPA